MEQALDLVSISFDNKKFYCILSIATNHVRFCGKLNMCCFFLLPEPQSLTRNLFCNSSCFSSYYSNNNNTFLSIFVFFYCLLYILSCYNERDLSAPQDVAKVCVEVDWSGELME